MSQVAEYDVTSYIGLHRGLTITFPLEYDPAGKKIRVHWHRKRGKPAIFEISEDSTAISIVGQDVVISLNSDVENEADDDTYSVWGEVPHYGYEWGLEIGAVGTDAVIGIVGQWWHFPAEGDVSDQSQEETFEITLNGETILLTINGNLAAMAAAQAAAAAAEELVETLLGLTMAPDVTGSLVSPASPTLRLSGDVEGVNMVRWRYDEGGLPIAVATIPGLSEDWATTPTTPLEVGTHDLRVDVYMEAGNIRQFWVSIIVT